MDAHQTDGAAPRRLDPHTIRRIAVEAGRDPRTVQAVSRGQGSPLASAAIREAARRLGIDLDPGGGAK
jgi:hypothetical protein